MGPVALPGPSTCASGIAAPAHKQQSLMQKANLAALEAVPWRRRRQPPACCPGRRVLNGVPSGGRLATGVDGRLGREDYSPAQGSWEGADLHGRQVAGCVSLDQNGRSPAAREVVGAHVLQLNMHTLQLSSFTARHSPSASHERTAVHGHSQLQCAPAAVPHHASVRLLWHALCAASCRRCCAGKEQQAAAACTQVQRCSAQDLLHVITKPRLVQTRRRKSHEPHTQTLFEVSLCGHHKHLWASSSQCTQRRPAGGLRSGRSELWPAHGQPSQRPFATLSDACLRQACTRDSCSCTLGFRKQHCSQRAVAGVHAVGLKVALPGSCKLIDSVGFHASLPPHRCGRISSFHDRANSAPGQQQRRCI